MWIKDFVDIYRPLVKLMKKDMIFEWTAIHQQAMDILKDAVTTSPAIHPMDYTSSDGDIHIWVWLTLLALYWFRHMVLWMAGITGPRHWIQT